MKDCVSRIRHFMPFLAPNFRRFNPFLAPNFRRFNPFLAPNFRKTSIFAPDYQCITNYEKYLKRHIDNKVDCDGNSGQIKTALETLILAGLVYPVTHPSANGIPLGAEINEKYRRMIFLDTGLLQSILGLNIADFIATTDMQVINRGAIAETFVGNEIIKSSPCYEPRSLYCWHREKSGSNAEVDYVVQLGDKIRPIEVKSGIKGSMQSMRIFLQQKGIDYGIRTSLENFSCYDDIRVYPLYAIKNIFK